MKTIVPLTVAALMSSSALAVYLQNAHFDIPTCTGQYGEDMSSFFVDCYNTDGVLYTRNEYFFNQILQKKCSSVNYTDIESNLTGWYIPQNVSNSTSGNVAL